MYIFIHILYVDTHDSLQQIFIEIFTTHFHVYIMKMVKD